MTEETLLHRQVHPTWIQNNIVSEQAFATSQTFTPTPKDEGYLSMYNGDKYTPEESYKHYTSNPSFVSAAVLSVSILEVASVKDLDTTEDNYPFDGHTYIDFSKLTSKGILKKKSQKLRDIAMERGWTHKI